MSARPEPVAVASAVAVAVIGGDASYDMFEVVSIDAAGAKLRGPLLFEISEELGLRVTRNGASAIARGRVVSHDLGDDTITSLVFVDGASELARLLG